MVNIPESRAAQAAGPLMEKFATTAGRWLGWFGVAVGVGMVVIEPVTSAQVNVTVVLLGVALVCLCWVSLIRPRASAHERALLMQNMLRDIAVPWRKIERCQVGQTLVVYTTEAERFHGLGVTRSARSLMREQYGTTSILLNFGGRVSGRRQQERQGPSVAAGEWQGGTYTSYVESRIAGLASTGERGGEGDPDADPVVAWAPVPVTLLVLGAVCVAVALAGV
jgi:hypothetical protein